LIPGFPATLLLIGLKEAAFWAAFNYDAIAINTRMEIVILVDDLKTKLSGESASCMLTNIGGGVVSYWEF